MTWDTAVNMRRQSEKGDANVRRQAVSKVYRLYELKIVIMAVAYYTAWL